VGEVQLDGWKMMMAWKDWVERLECMLHGQLGKVSRYMATYTDAVTIIRKTAWVQE
jgi:hypothetical protein